MKLLAIVAENLTKVDEVIVDINESLSAFIDVHRHFDNSNYSDTETSPDIG